MTKNDIVLDIAAKLNMKQSTIKRIVQLTLDGMLEIIATEGRLELRNFGVFEVRSKKPYKARNPKTGETVMVPEKKVTHFKPGMIMMGKVLASLEENEDESPSRQDDNNANQTEQVR